MTKYSMKYVCNACSEPCEMLVKTNYDEVKDPHVCPLKTNRNTAEWVFKWMRTTVKPGGK